MSCLGPWRKMLSTITLSSVIIANTPRHTTIPTAMSSLRLLVALFALSLLSPIPITAQNSSQGLWGPIKESADSTTQPVRESICSRYNKLSDKGRFFAGACAGYGASRFVVGSKFCLLDAWGLSNIHILFRHNFSTLASFPY